MYHGDIRLGDTIYILFTTVNTSGVPTTLSGTPVLSAYVDNGTTEITAGVSVSADFDTRTGLNLATVVATSGNGFASGSDVAVVVTTGTVGGSSVVGYVVGTFSIDNRSALRPTTAGRELDVTAGGTAGIDWGNVENPTTSVDLSATNTNLVDTATAVTNQVTANVTAISGDGPAADNLEADYDGTGYAKSASTVGTVTTLTGHTAQTGDNFARLGAPAGASVSADIAAVQSDTDNLQTRVPAALVGGRMDSSVGAMAADVLTASALATDAVNEIADGVHDEALSGHQTQGTAGAALTMAAYMGPRGPGIYIDDAAANTGTTIGDDGTLENPVSTIAAATTLSTNMGVDRFYLINNSSITLAQAYDDYEFVGIGLNNQVNLGSQSVDNVEFHGLTLTGTQGGTGQLYASYCYLTALASLEGLFEGCWLTGNNTVRDSNQLIFNFCKSAVAGNTAPQITLPGSGTTDLMFRHYSGGLQVNSAASGDEMSFESDGQLVIDATCTSLAVTIRGNCSITDNGTTTSITQTARIAADNTAEPVAANVVEVSDDAGAANNLEADYDGTGYNKSASTIGTASALTGHTAQTGDNFARLGAPVGASISADIAGVQSDTDNIQTRLPAALVGGRIDADVGNMQTDVLSAAALSAAAAQEIRDEILPTQNAAFNNIMFLFVAASDNVTPVTGASGMAVTRSIDGGSFGSGTGTGPAEIGNGIYQYDASAADMNGGVITFRFTATGGTPGAPNDTFVTIVTGGV